MDYEDRQDLQRQNDRRIERIRNLEKYIEVMIVEIKVLVDEKRDLVLALHMQEQLDEVQETLKGLRGE